MTIYQPNPDVGGTGEEAGEFVEPAAVTPSSGRDAGPADPRARPSGEPPVGDRRPEAYDGAVGLGDDSRVRVVVHIDDLDSPRWTGLQRAGDEPVAVDAFGEEATRVQLCEGGHPRSGEVASAVLELRDDTRVHLVGDGRFRP